MQAAVCQMFPDKNCAVSDEELARGDPDAGAPRTPIPDPDLPTIQRTATTRDLGLANPPGATAPTRPASFEPPIPLPPGGQTLLPPTDDPTIREFSGIEDLERGLRALGEGDLPAAATGLLFGSPVGPGRLGKLGERAAELTRQAAQRTRQAAERLNSTLRDAWQRLLREQRGGSRPPGGGATTPPQRGTPSGDRSAGPQPAPTGLKDASSGLRGAFDGGNIRDHSITGLRSALTENGFSRQRLTTNRGGYRFDGPDGEQVRIMRRGGGWDVRVQNRYGNYLDEFGNVASPQNAHGITLRAK
jgi:hypothetical protein